MLLALDTSTQWIGLALYDGTQVFGEEIWQTHNHHTVEIAPAVQRLMGRCAVLPSALEGIGVALGPGSFTSLRIGLAVAKGMALALHLPVAGIPSLDVLAAAHPKKLYLLLGTNTLTTLGAADRFLAYYGQMLDLLRQTLGNDCVIYVQSIPPVRPAAAAEKPGLASDVIRSVNEQLALLAADKGCVYLDLWETFADGEGNLKEVLAAPDGIHFSAGNGYGAWVTYLRNHAKYSAANAWTPGSAYAAN